MSETLRGRFQAAVVAIAPLFLLAAVAYHPFVGNLTDRAEVAGAISADTARWTAAHVAVGAGMGLLLAAFLAVCSYLRRAGEERWSATAVPFLVMGTTFSLFLPAMETVVGAATRAGADPESVLAQIRGLFLPLMVGSSLLSAIGVLLVATSVVRSGAIDPERSKILAGALVIMAISRFVPQGTALYAGALAGVVALVPIAVSMWKRLPVLDRIPGAAVAGGR